MIQVLLAAYNGEAYLPAQLDSLLAQEETDFQVLWQDDGSTDGTPGILAEYTRRDTRFRPGAQQGQHLGAKGNFLSLMRQCTALYAATCDQDDIWLPAHLRLQREAMAQAERQYGADTPILVHGDAVVMDAEGNTLHPSFFAHQGWDPAATQLSRLLVQNNVTGCAMMMNTALLSRVTACPRAEETYMHDWFVALTAAAFGHIVFVNQPLLRYRQTGENVKGASAKGLRSRGLRALSDPERSRARIALSYQNAKAFLQAHGDTLPADARQVVEGYIATETMPRNRRLRALREGNYLMQSPVTRMGQWIFG